MAPSQCFLENDVDPMAAYLMNKLDDDEFADVLSFANTWTEADLDAALRGGVDASKLPERHATAPPSGPFVNGDAQQPPSLSTSQIQLARLRSAWKRAQTQKAFLNQTSRSDTCVSPALSTLDLQQHEILDRWGLQVAPRTPPKDGTGRNPSPAEVTGNVEASSHVAHKTDGSEVLIDNNNPKALTERHGAWGPQALTKPLLEDEAGAPESAVSLNVEQEEEDDRPPKHLVHASYILALVYWMTGFIYGMFRAGWSLVDSFYFVTVTISTVGYGDKTFSQGDAFDKVFGAIYVFVGVVIISVAAGIILNEWQLKAEAMVAKKMQKSEQDIADGKPPKFDFNAEMINVFFEVFKTFGVIGIALAVGTVGMVILEDWSFSDSFYFCSITMTTVGYGDLVPQNNKSKLFVTVYILFAFGVLASSMSAVGAVPFRIQELNKINKCLSLLGDSLEAEELQALCECTEIVRIRNLMQVEAATNNPHILRSEFVLWQLMKQGKLKMDDVAPCLATFDSLDTDGSGNLNEEDIDLYLKHQAEKTLRGVSQREPPSSPPLSA